jgi:TPR repeat protein
MLGAAYHLGSGVTRDPVAAFAWLLRARAGGSALANPYFAAVHQRTTEPLSERCAGIFGEPAHDIGTAPPRQTSLCALQPALIPIAC